jgi:3-hydroxyisobutyrate dehydrogenase
MNRIGVVGVGNMGLPIALRLAGHGYRVVVRDLLAEREAMAAGCAVAPSAAALADRCDLVIVVVVDAAQTRDVLFGEGGVTHADAGPRAVLLCPTIAPADTEACAQGLAAVGIGMLDAPMSGGPLRARDGTMSLMAAGPALVFEECRGVLAVLSNRIFRISERPGDGARTKLVNNLLAAVNLAGAAEAIVLAKRLGLDAAATLAVIEQSSGQSWIGSDRMRRALAGDRRAQAHLRLLAKDSALALGEARDAGLPLGVGSAAAAVFAAAVAGGLQEADDSLLLPWLAGEADAQR